MQWYLKVLKQYVDFSGRARRTEFWMFSLVNAIVLVLLYALTLGGALADSSGIASVFGALYVIYALAVLLPSIAVTVRRLHDTDRSGGWWFIGLVPLVGAIVLIVFNATEGDRGPNRFGPDPKAEVFTGGQQPGPAPA